MNITPFEALAIEAEEIDAMLATVPPEEVAEVIDHGNELVALVARAGKMLADARYHLNEALSGEITRASADRAGLPASSLNKLVDALCSRERRLVDQVERLNRSATHRLDWLRTVVSHAKEEMRLSPGINNQNANR
jgi:hypothetical protein